MCLEEFIYFNNFGFIKRSIQRNSTNVPFWNIRTCHVNRKHLFQLMNFLSRFLYFDYNPMWQLLRMSKKILFKINPQKLRQNFVLYYQFTYSIRLDPLEHCLQCIWLLCALNTVKHIFPSKRWKHFLQTIWLIISRWFRCSFNWDCFSKLLSQYEHMYRHSECRYKWCNRSSEFRNIIPQFSQGKHGSSYPCSYFALNPVPKVFLHLIHLKHDSGE